MQTMYHFSTDPAAGRADPRLLTLITSLHSLEFPLCSISWRSALLFNRRWRTKKAPVSGAESQTQDVRTSAPELGRPPVPLLHSLEGLRLVASVGIASLHILPHVGLNAPHYFALFVDLFFVISGIVIGGLYLDRMVSWSAYTTFIRRRLARIYPLHLATLLFYVLLGIGIVRYHVSVQDPARFDTGQIVPNLLLIQSWFPWQAVLQFRVLVDQRRVFRLPLLPAYCRSRHPIPVDGSACAHHHGCGVRRCFARRVRHPALRAQLLRSASSRGSELRTWRVPRSLRSTVRPSHWRRRE